VSASWPSSPPQGPRRRLDPRWLTVIVIAVIVVIVLVRQNKLHISEQEVLFFLAIIPSIILHEVTHGWVALAFGDDTAKRARRLSLNPLVHVSLFGTLMLPALLVLGGYPPFGWAKPVPVNMSRLRHPRNQHVVVALAGPAMNIVLTLIFGLLFRVIVSAPDKGSIYYYGVQSGIGQPVWAQYLFSLGYVNVILAVFNLIPIPPLDGSSVLERLMPRQWLPGYLSIRPYTIFLPFLIIWLHPQWLDQVFQPFLNTWAHLLGAGTIP
jgi:Zn-dependent protease